MLEKKYSETLHVSKFLKDKSNISWVMDRSQAEIKQDENQAIRISEFHTVRSRKVEIQSLEGIWDIDLIILLCRNTKLK